MAFRFCEMGAKVANNPKGAAADIAAALKRCDGYAVDAAKELGVDYRTFTRWLERLAAAGHDPRVIARMPARRGRPRTEKPKKRKRAA